MNQTRLGSIIEAAFGTVIGLVVSMLANPIILPVCGCKLTFWNSLGISTAYTLVSVARGYCVRRWFNARLHAAAQRLAGGGAR